MVPRPLSDSEETFEPLDALPVLTGYVRGTLVGIALGLTAVFVIASRLDPYQGGATWRMGTHTQLPWMMPCTFYVWTGRPCPSCGMTTSFALLIRGDVISSLRANWAGTLLATFCLLFIPWSLASVYRKQPLFILSIERTLLWLLAAFICILLARWATVLLLAWWNGTFA